MKKVNIIAGLLGAGLVISLYVNVAQHSTVTNQQQIIQSAQKKEKKSASELASIKRDNRTLKTQVDSAKTTINNSGKSSTEIEFNNVSNDFLKSMFTYDSKSYEQRKDKVKDLLSDKLFEQYFPKNQFFGDSNNVTSKLDKAQVYTKSLQDSTMQGMAVIDYESKSGDNDFKKDTVVYQLTFDTTTNKLTDVQNLGHVMKGNNVQ